MPLKTTVIGAWPKPSYLNLSDWFQSGQNSFNPPSKDDHEKTLQTNEDLLAKAIDEVVAKQLDIGIDVITDGEMSREAYFLHFVRQIQGMNADNLVDKKIRNGACELKAVSITAKLESKAEWAFKEWDQIVQSVQKWLKSQDEKTEDLESKAKSRVKYTLPGPMTILDCTVDQFYGEDRKQELTDDLIKVINAEILSLVKHGCKVIQLDEPVLMRYPKQAIAYGIKDVQRCFEGVPDDVTTAVHLCCGYPTYCDQDDYVKADKSYYITLAKLLDETGVDQISIEDAEAQNDLEQLLPHFKKMTVIFGAIAIARSKVESFEDVKKRVEVALKYIDPERLVLAPDCGLGYLNDDVIEAKLKVMVEVAKKF